MFFKPVWAPCALLVLCLALPVRAGEGIRPFPDNPRYWELRGEPVVLIGGSRQDSVFQISDLEDHLDLLVEYGGNYVRNTMSHRASGAIWAFRQQSGRSKEQPVDEEPFWIRVGGRLRSLLPGGSGVYPRFDLDQERPEYWERLESLLRLASERDIVVQIEVWDRFDFARRPWRRNPFNPVNNVNYTEKESGLESHYPEHPNRNRNPFFRSVPTLENNELLLEYQRAYVDRLLSVSLEYDNVLYTVSNETNGEPAWSEYWARHIRERADEHGVDVYITEMWDDWDLTAPMHDNTFGHPELYDFADVSQNNHQSGQTHWDNLQARWRELESRPWPLNNVKIYGADGGRFGSDRDAVERFWRNLLGGAASVRFHRPRLGIGLGPLARSHIHSARMVADRLDWVSMRPANELLTNREPDRAYLFANPGNQYLLFFPDGGQVTLRSPGAGQPLEGHWLAPDSAEWTLETRYPGDDQVTITAPDTGRWVLLLERSSP